MPASPEEIQELKDKHILWNRVDELELNNELSFYLKAHNSYYCYLLLIVFRRRGFFPMIKPYDIEMIRIDVEQTFFSTHAICTKGTIFHT